MKNVIAFIFIVLLVSGCSLHPETSLKKVWVSHDVLDETLTTVGVSAFTKLTPMAQSCESQLQKSICLSKDKNLGFDQNCSAADLDSKVTETIIDIYKELPKFQQEVLCKLPQIQIHTEMFSVGYASLVRDENNKVLGGLMGLSLKLFEGSSVSKTVSWKEQLNFGLSKLDDPARAPGRIGPQVQLTSNLAQTEIAFVLIHEVYHLIDMYNDINGFGENLCQSDPEQPYLVVCKIPEGSFPRLSWGEQMTYAMRDAPADLDQAALNQPWKNKAPLLAKLCYYWCGPNIISPTLVQDLYAQMYLTSFVTPYSSVSNMEDFADAASFWLLGKMGAKPNWLMVDENQKVLYDLQQHLKTPEVITKMQWLENYFKNPDLKSDFDL